MFSSPLLVQGWQELGERGRVHRDYLALLAIQAFVLLIWWPKSTLYFTLVGQHSPNTVLAMSIASGACISYIGIRFGAEEFRSAERYTLLEWVVLTDISITRALLGYVLVSVMQMVYWLLLTAPLMVLALTINPSNWQGAGLNLLGVTLLGVSHILVGGLLYVWIGHRATLAYLVVRATFLTWLAGTAFFLAPVSHVVLAYRQFGETRQPDGPEMVQLIGWGIEGSASVFVAIYCALIAVLITVLGRLLAQRRAQHAARANGADAPGFDQ